MERPQPHGDAALRAGTSSLAGRTSQNDRLIGAYARRECRSRWSPDGLFRVLRIAEIEDHGVAVLADVDEPAVPIGADEGRVIAAGRREIDRLSAHFAPP